jgi:homopolymeric O-antigen transport system ATP-binding protein
MSAIALSFDHVSKHYRGAYEYRTFRDELAAGASRLLGRQPRPRRVIRALDDVSLAIPAGQSFGLIGENGAGKTTALKLATRITYPTTGRLQVRGRVGALIEVGTGMHPELTGRENVSLYGRILGLSRRDVQSRFEEIVEFAGVGTAIDQPVKQYSSGMQLRLGFSVAAHLEPDVLLVDEAIAVGDAGFQYRCVERMSRLVQDGCTLVFVSHDMSAVETLCKRAAILRSGRIDFEGAARDAVRRYLGEVHASLADGQPAAVRGSDQLDIVRVSLLNASGDEVRAVRTGDQLTIRLQYHARGQIVGPLFSVGLSDPGIGLLTLASMLVDGHGPERIAGDGHVDCTFKNLPLRTRTYEIWGSVRGADGYGDLVDWQRFGLFQVTGDEEGAGKSAVSQSMLVAPVTIPYAWSVPGGTCVRG